MNYTQPELPYKREALEPIISRETVDYHYGKHEKTYIDNLNNLIEGTEWADMALEDIIRKAEGPLFNNASQAWNHILYFFSFSPDGGGEPDGELGEAIKKQFGSFEEFKKQFEDAGAKLFGSGWVWLSHDDQGSLFIRRAVMLKIRSPRGLPRYSHSMFGSMPTISTIRTAEPNI